MRNILLYFSIKYNGDWWKIYKAIEKKEFVSEDDVQECLKKVNSKFITVVDKDYPEQLKLTENPPFVIFYIGEINLLSKYKQIMSVVGDESPDEYGISLANNFTSKILKSNMLISTILTHGINEIIIEKIKENMSRSILVIDNNFSNFIIEKKQLINLKNILIISIKWNNDTNLEKNLIEGYSLLFSVSSSILFIQFNDNKFFKEIVKIGYNEGKDFYAIPSKIDQISGTNKLIKIGAKLVDDFKDIVL